MNRTREPWLIGGVLAGLMLATATTSLVRSADDETPNDAERAARQQSANNLKQLALAMHSYHDTYNHLPAAAIKDNKGKSLLSWRVAILPFIEEDKLFKEFHLEEPWDSAHNKKLLAKMPKLYAPVMGKTKQPHSTYYQVFTGDGAWGGNAPPRIPVTFQDGTANTILIIEAGEGVPWTKPADLDYQAKMAIPKLGGMFKTGFHIALADGSDRLHQSEKDQRGDLARSHHAGGRRSARRRLGRGDGAVIERRSRDGGHRRPTLLGADRR